VDTEEREENLIDFRQRKRKRGKAADLRPD